MIEHPIKLAYSVFLVLLFLGIFFASNQRVSRVMIPLVALSGLIAVLTQLWSIA